MTSPLHRMRRRPIIVEQLNRSQWHASVPHHGGTGVGSYVHALADGLLWAALNQRGLVTVDLDGEIRLIVRNPSPQVIGGGA